MLLAQVLPLLEMGGETLQSNRKSGVKSATVVYDHSLHPPKTQSHQILNAKQSQVWLVLGWKELRFQQEVGQATGISSVA